MYSTVIDVIGVVEDLEPIHMFHTRDGQVEVIRFTIFDGRYDFQNKFIAR